MAICFLAWVGSVGIKKDFWNCYSDELFLHFLLFPGKLCYWLDAGLMPNHSKQLAKSGSNVVKGGTFSSKQRCV